MSALRLHAIAGLLLATLALPGCRSSTEPGAGLTIGAVASRAVIAPDEEIRVSVTVANEGPTAVKVPGGSPALLEVRSADGQVIAFGRFELMAAIALPLRSLAPGQVISDELRWPGELKGVPGLLRAGTYQLRAAVPVMGAHPDAYVYGSPLMVTISD